MKNIKKEYKITAILFTVITLILFWQFFFKGLHPYPGSFLLAWFEPWKSENIINDTILIAHKPVADDVFRQLYPFKTLAADMLKNLELPLWNPYNGSGMPLFAAMHVGFLNPLNFIFFILPPALSWSILVIIQPFLVGFLLYLYCRTIGVSKLGSALSGVSFMFSGFVITRSIYNDYNFAVIGTILVLIILEKYFFSNKRYILLLPFLIFFIISSTQPQIITYCLLFILGYFFYRIMSIKTNNKNKDVLIFLIFFFLGTGFSAIQLVPTFELYQQSNLTIQSSRFIIERFLLPPMHLVSVFIPNYFGNQSTYNYWGAGDYVESIASIGLVTCFFAYLALYKVRFSLKDIRLFFLAAIIISIIITIKSPITSFLYSLPIPILSTGVPSRILFITTFSLSILAGLGLSNIFRTNYNKKQLTYAIVFSIVPLLIIASSIFLFLAKADCNNPIIINCWTIALRNTFLETFVFFLAFLTFVLSIRKNRYKIFSSTVIVLLVAIVGIYNGQKFLPFSSDETFSPRNELIEQIQKNSGYSRIFGLGSANIKTNFATSFRFFDPNYYEPLYNRKYAELVTFSNTGSTSRLERSDIEVSTDLNLEKNEKERRDRLLNLLGIEYFIFKKSEVSQKSNENIAWQNQKWKITKNKKALPRVYLVSNFAVIQNTDNILKRLFDQTFDFKNSVILEENPNLNFTQEKPQISKTVITEYKENNASIKTSSDSNQMLILSDNFYPGWKAFVDDKETKIYRANYTFRAVEVPKGKHLVRFSYEPNSFKIGVVISIVSTIIYIIIAVYMKSSAYTLSSRAKREISRN